MNWINSFQKKKYMFNRLLKTMFSNLNYQGKANPKHFKIPSQLVWRHISAMSVFRRFAQDCYEFKAQAGMTNELWLA